MNIFFLYNLMDYGISLNTVKSIMHSYPTGNIDINDIKKTINEKIHVEVFNDLYSFKSYMSIKVLYELDLPHFILEKIFLKYKTFEDLVRAIEQDNVHISDKVKKQVFNLVDRIGEDNIKVDMLIKENTQNKTFNHYKKSLIKIIKKYYCSSTRDIIKRFKEEGNTITTMVLSSVMNELRKEGIIGYSSNQYVVLNEKEPVSEKKVAINDYIQSENTKIKNMFSYLDSFYKEDILNKLNKTKHEYEEQIRNIINVSPIFIHEKRLHHILSNYDVPYRLINKKYPSVLYYYIKFKYDLNPTLSYLEFLKNEEDFDKEEVEKYLNFKKKYMLNNEIKNILFTNLIIDFYNSNNFTYINKNHYLNFFEFCNKVIPSHKSILPRDSDKFIKEISSLSFFHKHSQGYIYFDPRNFPEETKTLIKKIISGIDYPISYKDLFVQHMDILKENYINNTFGFSVMIKSINEENVKVLDKYLKPCNEKIEDFIFTVIMESEIQSKEKLIMNLNNNYNFKDEYYDTDIKRIIGKYFDRNQILKFVEINSYHSNLFNDFIKDGFCTIEGIEWFIKENSIDYKETNFIHPVNLKKFNLKKDGRYLYLDKFNSFDEAFITYLEQGNKTIFIDRLLELLGEYAFECIYAKYSKKFYFIKYTKHYLVNLINKDNIESKESLLIYRDSIIQEMDTSMIYNYNELFNSSHFRKISTDDILAHYEQKIAMVSLLETSNQISVKETNRFLFRKQGKINKAEILKVIMNGKTYISYSELVEILENDYGYISTNDLEYLFNKLDLMYKPILDMVFINTEEYYKKLEEIDNEWEN